MESHYAALPLVYYDVCDDKVLWRNHKLIKDYDEARQDPVLSCTLKAIGRVRKENAARELLNLREDHLLIVDLGANEEAATVLGPALHEQESGVVVI